MNHLQHNFSGIIFHKKDFLHYDTLKAKKHTFTSDNISLEISAQKAENEKYILFISGYVLLKNKNISAMELLRLYSEKKANLRYSLDGNFTIFTINKKNNILSVVNNHHSSYTTYIYENENFTVFASSIKKILDILPFKINFNPNSLDNFLTTGFNRSTQMQFKDIYRLQASHYINFDKPFAERKNFWSMPFTRKPLTNTETTINKYEEFFKGSIETFIDTTKPQELGCLLSGGQDTSMTFMYAAKKHSKPVHTFTASFPYLKYDELTKAKQVNDTFGGIHHNVEINGATLDLIPQMIQTAEEPLSGGTLAIYACAHAAKDKINGIITGDGGDTYWGEYYPIAAWNKILSPLPFPLRKAAHKAILALAKITDSERLAEAEHVFSLMAEKDIYNDFFSRMSSYRQFNSDKLLKCLANEYMPDTTNDSYSYEVNFAKENLFDNMIEAKILYGVLQYMNPPTEKSFNSFGINFHTPYNNNELINFINSIPHKDLNHGTIFHYLTNKATSRITHKKLMLRYFPKSFVFSSQQSLDMPYVYLLHQKKHLSAILLEKLISRGWYNEKNLKQMFKEFSSQKISQKESCRLKHHGYRIYSLLTFEVWAQIFLDKKPVPALDTNHRTDTQLEDFLR